MAMTSAFRRRLLAASLLFSLCLAGAVRAQSVETRGDLRRRGRLGAGLRQVAATESAPGVVEISGVAPGSAAEKAGLLAGERVASAHGAPVTTVADYFRVTWPLRAGEKLELRVVAPDGAERYVSVELDPAPFESWESLDVVYDAVEANGTLARTIATKPVGRDSERLPALLMLPGYSCYAQELNGVPDELTERFVKELGAAGVVVMRADRPGMGDSLGGYCPDIDFAADVAVYEAALARLKEYEFVDPRNVFLFGHSLGGVVAPRIACRQKVKGVAVYGTVAVPWSEYLVNNWRRQFPMQDRDPVDTENYVRATQAFNALFYGDKKSPAQVREERPDLAEYIDSVFPDLAHAYGRHYAFAQGIEDIHVAASWRDCGARCLAMWGEADFVSGPEDHQLIADIVNKYRPGQGEFVEVPASDHGMNRAATLIESVERSFAETKTPAELNPAAIEALRDWILRVAAEEA